VGAAVTAAPVDLLVLQPAVAFIGGVGDKIFLTADTELVD